MAELFYMKKIKTIKFNQLLFENKKIRKNRYDLILEKKLKKEVFANNKY